MSVGRLLDCRHGDNIINTPQLNQEQITNWFRFMRHLDANGIATVVATQTNNGGTGEDFHDQTNPLGENSFIYTEFDQGVARFGILVQFADAGSFGASPGNPALLQDSASLDGIGIQMAWREDGTSPWGGTTNDDGLDTKGTPVWTAGGSTVHVFPRSNNPGPPLGDHNTNKENMMRVGADDATGFSRHHWVANENGLFTLSSVSDNSEYTASYLGRYTPRTGLAALTQPYCAISHNAGSLMWDSGSGVLWGSTTGGTSFEGGIVGRLSEGVARMSINFSPTAQDDVAYQPNQLIVPNEFEGSRLTVFQREVVSSLCGYVDPELFFILYNSTANQTNAAASRAYLGTATQAARKWAINWDGGAPPTSNNTRLGRLSYTA